MLRAIAALLIVCASLGAPDARADGVWRAGANVSVTADGAPNVRAAGAAVTIRGRVGSDIWAAGAIVDIDARTGADVWAAGSRINVAGRVGGMLSATGAEVNIAAQIDGTARAAGAKVAIAPEAVVRGQVRAAGALVTFAGRSSRDVELSGEEVVFDGEAAGHLVIRARKVTIGDAARIGGNLEIYSSARPDIGQRAQIGGRIVTLGLEDADWPDGFGISEVLLALAIPFVIAVSAFIFGAFGVLVARGAVEQTIDLFLERPGGSLLRGILLLLVIILCSAVLAAVVVGLPLGVALLLGLPAIMIAGLAGAGLSLGEWIANRAGEPRSAGGRVALLALGIAVLTLVGLIPVLGTILVILAILMGLGAAVMTARSRLAPESGPAAS